MSPRQQNASTQPLLTFEVFDNADVISHGWYVACASDELGARGVRAAEIGHQRIVVFRGEDGRPRALDAFCPHMGTDLAIGRVVGETIRCFFHHWRFDGDGRCVDVPCAPSARPPDRARLQSYATCEKYGFVWVWPDATAPAPVASFPGLESEEVVTWHDRPFERTCHHHVSMINGIDPQHLATVHNLRVEMSVELSEHEGGRVIDFVLRGEVPGTSLTGRLTRALIGPRYAYAMRYADACLGLLTTAMDLRWFGSGPRIPEVRTGYAYTPLASGRTCVRPFFVARRGAGALGWLMARALLLAAWIGYRALASEDGRIYENMRFQPNALLPLDRPVGRFIAYVNRLAASRWSRAPRSPSGAAPAQQAPSPSASAASSPPLEP